MRSVGVIVARGGSKRIPRKVLKPILGQPMLAWMAGAALASRLDLVVLSTDDEEIAAVGRALGLSVPFLRPPELAQDFVCNDEVVLHALDAVEASGAPAAAAAVLLQPTAPFILPAHIDACLDTLAHSKAACCFTAKRASEPPQWMFTPEADGSMKLLMGGELAGERQHTQKLASYFLPSGAVWAVRAEVLRRTRKLYTRPLRIVEVMGVHGLDIDVEDDLVIADALARAHGLAPAAPKRKAV